MAKKFTISPAQNKSKMNQEIKRQLVKKRSMKVETIEEKSTVTPFLNAALISGKRSGSKKESYFVASRLVSIVNGKETGKFNLSQECNSLDDARDLINKITETAKVKESLLLDKYKSSAHQLIRKIVDNNSSTMDGLDLSSYKNLLDINYLFVVGFELCNGFKAHDTGKLYGGRHQRKSASVDYRTAVRVSRTFEEPVVLVNKGSINGSYYESKIQAAMDNYVKKYDVTKKETLCGYYDSHFIFYVKKATEFLGPGYSIADAIVQQMKTFIRSHSAKGEHLVDGKKVKLNRSEAHKTLTSNDIRRIAKEVFKEGVSHANTLFLGLSTGLRPECLKLLTDGNNPHYYAVGFDGATSPLRFFNYKGGEISIKTSRVVDPKELSNPVISILAAVLMRDYPFAKLGELEKVMDKLILKKKIYTDDGKPLFPRRFRATLGHSYIQCERAINRSAIASHNDIKEKLGHKTTEQSIKTYAKNIPDPSKSAEAYFQFKSLVIGGNNITDGSPLYDTFLIDVYLSCIPSEKGKKEFAQKILEEWKQRKVDSGIDSIEVSSY